MKKSTTYKGSTEQEISGGPKVRKIAKRDIRKRAYQLFLERGPFEGSQEDDWLQAEDELFSSPGY